MLRTTARTAASTLSGEQIASINVFVIAGLSPAEGAATAYTSLSFARTTVHAALLGKRRPLSASRCSRSRETSVLLVLSFTPLRGPFGPSADTLACRVGGGALDCSRAGLRPPLKLGVQFSRTQLSRRRCSLSSDGRYHRNQVHKPVLAVKLAAWQCLPAAAAPSTDSVRPDPPHQPPIEPVKELSDVSPLVVVAPATHDGVDLLYQLLSVDRSLAPRESSNLVFEAVNRFLPGISVQPTRLDTTLDLAGWQGGNGIFTSELVNALGEPGVPIEQMFKRVIAAVYERTKHHQTPWMEASLQGDFYFVAPGAHPTIAPPPALPPSIASAEVVFWQSISTSNNRADFEAYLNEFPQGTYAQLARNRLAMLTTPPTAGQQAPAQRVAVSPPPVPAPKPLSSSGGSRFLLQQCGAILDSSTSLEWYISADVNFSWQRASEWIQGLDACGGGWSMPTVAELKTLFNPNETAGTGYFTRGTHWPAHINPIFGQIGGGSWVWIGGESVSGSAPAFNFNQGVEVRYSATGEQFPTRAFAVRRKN